MSDPKQQPIQLAQQPAKHRTPTGQRSIIRSIFIVRSGQQFVEFSIMALIEYSILNVERSAEISTITR